MNKMPISECYSPKFNIQPHYHRLIVYIHKVRSGISTQNGISNSGAYSLVILVIGIQDLYISKYKYTIKYYILKTLGYTIAGNGLQVTLQDM